MCLLKRMQSIRVAERWRDRVAEASKYESDTVTKERNADQLSGFVPPWIYLLPLKFCSSLLFSFPPAFLENQMRSALRSVKTRV